MATTATSPSSTDVKVPGSFPKAPHVAIDRLADATAPDVANDSIDPAAALHRAAEMASTFLPQSVAGALGLGQASHIVPSFGGSAFTPSGSSADAGKPDVISTCESLYDL